MKEINLTASFFNGEITVPPSKSFAHRWVIASALANKPTDILNMGGSEDIFATISCLSAMGAKALWQSDKCTISPIDLYRKHDKYQLNCGESGSTLRFLLPVVSALGMSAVIGGKGQLLNRPMTDLLDCLRANGITCNDNMPFDISGQLRAGDFVIRGDISSQFISGLMFALPLLDGDSKIIIQGTPTSVGYIDITLSVLKQFGIHIEKVNHGYNIKGNQKYISPLTAVVEGDWSNGAFWLVAGAINGTLKVKGLNMSSLQGDKAIYDILVNMGADIKYDNGIIYINKSHLSPLDIDAADIPDLVPILSVLCSQAGGKSVIKNVERLRIKECDRLHAIVDVLSLMGAKIGYNGYLNIDYSVLSGATVDGYNDHRIVMSEAISASVASRTTIINGYQAVAKSYPTFFDDYIKLGGVAYIKGEQNDTHK